MSKAFVLALAAAAGRAQADAGGIVVRLHNPDGLGAPTPGGAADGVVVAAPEGPIERAGISSGLEALAALHQKGALTDSEFAAAKAKLLG